MLLLDGKYTHISAVAQALSPFFQVDVFNNTEEAMAALRRESYHVVLSDVGDFLPLERDLVGQKASLVLNTIGEGVCIVDSDGHCAWSNTRMRKFTAAVSEKVCQICNQARAVFTRQSSPITDQSLTRSKKYTFQVESRYYEAITSPVIDGEGNVIQIVAVVWDATSSRRLQQKIDAIDQSGRELARLDAEIVMKAPAERLKIIREKIIKFSKDLMHFDHFSIRLLDKKSNKLEVVIAEGLPSEALDIDLYAQPEGNGISGYVASTGRSYICHDTEKDPRYVLGLNHAKSSLTTPLRLYDKILGVYNVESSEVGAFTEDDRQFAEIFGQHIAMALNILDLLVVERYTARGQITDNVVQEMAQPLNDIVTEAQTLMEEYIGDDSMRKRLYNIVEHVETIRQSLRTVKAGPKAVLGCEAMDTAVTDPRLCDKHILIADDEQNIRQTIADILRKLGAKCSVCKDGFEAVNLLNQEKFHLVISDIKMPYRNGYEIFAAARRCDEHLPVILMTGFGYDPHHSIVRASQEGLASVMFKPFKIEDMLVEVRKALCPEEPKVPDAKAPDASKPAEPAK
ncbi:MAG: response regulator [Phycisphaeraceae bacterium]